MLQKAVSSFAWHDATESHTLAAAVREYLGLSQEQLATYLNVSRGQVAHVEAGRRQLGAEAGRLLRELAAQLLPPGAGTVPAATGGRAFPPPVAKPLLRRLAECRWQLANRQARLVQLENQVELAQCWRGLAAASEPMLAPGVGAAATRRSQLLREWANVAGDAPQPEATAERQLLELRIRILAAECVALKGILLVEAESDLKALRHRATNLDYARDSTNEATTETQATLVGLDAEIQALTSVIPTLAEGTKARKSSEIHSRTATYRRARLTDRQEARGPVALLTRERNLAETEAQVTEIEGFIADITARKASL